LQRVRRPQSGSAQSPTAKVLGLEVPFYLQQLADKVIE